MENWGRRFTAETRRTQRSAQRRVWRDEKRGEKRFRAKSAKSAKKSGEKSKSQRAQRAQRKAEKRRRHAPTKGGMAASKATLQRLRDGREKGNGGQSHEH